MQQRNRNVSGFSIGLTSFFVSRRYLPLRSVSRWYLHQKLDYFLNRDRRRNGRLPGNLN
jgi:hypothetical protein